MTRRPLRRAGRQLADQVAARPPAPSTEWLTGVVAAIDSITGAVSVTWNGTTAVAGQLDTGRPLAAGDTVHLLRSAGGSLLILGRSIDPPEDT